MPASNKVLLVDDDQALLETYQELLRQLPSRPEIQTASSGAKALARLETEPFRLLICDLRMPKMDGLQVLTIVRRRFPKVRTVALTSVQDEQFRSRIYALGVDLFWSKPGNDQEVRLFLECLESLLGAEDDVGFRGVQSKSLMDLVQSECLSQSSSLLRITNGALTGKIWIQDGEVVDAAAGDLVGVEAFRRIFAWRGGGFETLPAEPGQLRRITQSYHGLLLDSAQAMDEAATPAGQEALRDSEAGPLRTLAAIPELSFGLVLEPGAARPKVIGELLNPDGLTVWTRETLAAFGTLGDQLQAGRVIRIEGNTPNNRQTLFSAGQTQVCIGWRSGTGAGRIKELTEFAISLWAC